MHPFDLVVQPLGRTGLAEDRSQCLAHLSGTQLWMTGQVEDRQAGSQTSGTPGQLESMQARHLQIGHQRVHGVAVSEDCQRLAAITRSGDGVTQLGEKGQWQASVPL